MCQKAIENTVNRGVRIWKFIKLTVITEKFFCFFWWNSDSYIKWKLIICIVNSGWSIPTRVCWSTWLHWDDKCYVLGMCNIHRSAWTLVTICGIMKFEKNIETLDQSLWPVIANFIYIPRWQCPMSCFTINNCLEDWKWLRLSWLAITVTRYQYYLKNMVNINNPSKKITDSEMIYIL